MSYILVIDQGTTGTGISLVSEKGTIVDQVDQEFPQIFPRPGWVEHNPDAIWKTVTSGIERILEKTNVDQKKIVAIGITNQRETVVAWDKVSGDVAHNAIVWQCRRTADYCSSLKKKGFEKLIRSKTGLVLDPYFSASKMNWLLKNVVTIKKLEVKGRLAFGTIDSFLTFRLSGGRDHITDVSNASRTSLLNLKTLRFDQELLKIFGVKNESLPTLVENSGILSKTYGLKSLRDGIPISSMVGDQQSALFGQGCFKKGDAKITFGTGSFLLLNTGQIAQQSRKGLLTTVAWQLKGKEPFYALEGGAFMCGAAIQFLRDQLGFFTLSSEVEALALEVEDSGGVMVVPTFAGRGAPHWNPEARGAILGLTRGSTKSHISLAILEALAFQNGDILNAMQADLKKKITKVRVDGGASANNLLMQLQSNCLRTQVDRPVQIETTTMGAAYMAGLGVGLWSSLRDIEKIWKLDKTFKPETTAAENKQKTLRWQKSLEAVEIFSTASQGD